MNKMKKKSFSCFALKYIRLTEYFGLYILMMFMFTD